MRISDWSSDVCSSDLATLGRKRQTGRLTHDLGIQKGRRAHREDHPVKTFGVYMCTEFSALGPSQKRRGYPPLDKALQQRNVAVSTRDMRAIVQALVSRHRCDERLQRKRFHSPPFAEFKRLCR